MIQLLDLIRAEIMLNKLFACISVEEIGPVFHYYDGPGIAIKNIGSFLFAAAKFPRILYLENSAIGLAGERLRQQFIPSCRILGRFRLAWREGQNLPGGFILNKHRLCPLVRDYDWSV